MRSPFTVNRPHSLMSRAELPTSTLCGASSTTNLPRVTSQNARSATSTAMVTVRLSPGASRTRSKPLSRRSGCLTRERRWQV